MTAASRGPDDTGSALIFYQLSVRRLIVASLLAVAVPSMGAFLLALGYGGAWPDGLRWALYMSASASIAVILGLIFGVPRARAEFAAEASERYASNSNLEQISDWLTKLLVGAGLVELKSLPALAKGIGDYLGQGMKVPNGGAYSVAAVVYGAGVGFAAGYLWTRLRLRMLLEISDREAADASLKREAIVSALREVNQASPDPEPERALQKAAESVVSSSRSAPRPPRPILWVDDNPLNNGPLVEALRSMGVHIDLALSTEEALELLPRQPYALVISDLHRMEHGESNDDAGLQLVQEIRQRGYIVPVFIYSSGAARFRANELREAGATWVTNRPSELLREATRVVTGS